MTELPDVPALRTLEPPPGGLVALRERLDERRPRWWLVAVPALVVAALVLVLVRTREAGPPARPNATALRDRQVGATFYWVASAPSAPAAPRHEVVPVTTISITDAPQVTSRPP